MRLGLPAVRGCVSEEVMKALVVDSSNTMRSVLHRILSMRGFEVAEADNCRQAMDVLRMHGYSGSCPG